jgi:hydroxymethylbilane synthase
LPLRLATRGSPLARWQAEHVAGLLGGDAELVIVDTAGDRRQDRPLWEIGGQGVFVKEVQAAVLDGRADAAVHSAKDLPSLSPDGLTIAAVPARADPRDVLVGTCLADLAPGAPVATGSVRRRAQLAWLRPDLTFPGLRGNIATRLSRIPAGGAVVMAAAALDRLGLTPEVVDVLDPDVMLPQVGQGAIAVEAGTGDQATRARLAAVDDPAAHAALLAERAFLARLGGGCDLPAGAFTVVDPGGRMTVRAVLASLDGRVLLRSARTGTDGPAMGAALAEELLAAGGRALQNDGAAG